MEANTAISQAVGGEVALDRVLELVVKRGRALVEAQLILLKDDDELVVGATAGESEAGAVGRRLPCMGTIPDEVLNSRHVERLAADFGEEDERVMRSFAASAAIAVATAQSVEAEQLRRSVEAAEHERGRWARELHDETLQGLGALQVLLDGALQRGTSEAIEEATRHAVGQIADEIDKLQTLITELRPAALDALGAEPAIVSLVERARALHGLEIHLDVDLDYEQGRSSTRHLPEIESTIYRLVQEALANVAKHARAERVSIRVWKSEDRVRIAVTDDGRGFEGADPGGGFGLIGMRERVDLVGGRLTVDSVPGRAPRSGRTSRRRTAPRRRTARPRGRLTSA